MKIIAFIKKRPLTLVLLILLVLLFCVLVVTQGRPNQRYLSQLFKKAVPSEKSQAQIFIKDSYLVVKVNLVNSQQRNFDQFSNNLGVLPKVFDEISFELDKNSLDKLSQILPATVFLEVEPKKLNFGDKPPLLLKSGLSKSDYTIATGSSKLDFRSNSNKDFYLEILDPGPLLNYATASGKLHLAKRTYGLFPILEKVARISLRVNGKSIEGEVKLK